MEVDPNSLDPDLRMAKIMALASVSFGLMSLCLAIVPACGGFASILGVASGAYSLKLENGRTALIGVIISILGVVVTIVYALFLVFFKQ